ncbi:MAG: tRNA 4-thiouridine(8) synthase ThiI [Desulfobacterales bacterium]
MTSPTKPARALGLCSGGLDSTLAALVLRQQGVTVEWVSFETPFFSAANARRAAEITGIPLTVSTITDDYLAMLRNPRCGYGQNMNPCLDCHALMFRKAAVIKQEKGLDFLFSGEVVGQRPMSQTKQSLRYVEKNSGCDGDILRPLSARLLPETAAEKNGLVDRAKLLDIAGRSRKRQMQLAEEFGLTEYPAPAGGCLLTDENFSKRLRELFDNQETLREDELHLLRYGRHFRLKNRAKLIVGRDEADNDNLLRHHDPRQDTVIRLKKYPGPIALIPGAAAKDVITLAASICAGYSRAPAFTPVEAEVTSGGTRETIRILGLPPSDVRRFLI